MKYNIAFIIFIVAMFCMSYLIHRCTNDGYITHNGVTVHVKDTAEYFKHLNK